MQGLCLKCHSTAEQEGDLDLERFATLDDARRDTKAWLKVAEMLDNGEMPPKKARQPSAEERTQLRGWVAQFLKAEAYANAGDPGPVVLRRLNNAQYTFTLRDLTGVDLRPAREFPADGAAGEGFTNAGNALAMSPALMGKYLDAGKAVASHAVLLPDGLRFSTGATRRDWTDEILGEIRGLYAKYADASGRIPLEKYLAATLEDREALANGSETPEAVAARRGLNARYLASLWGVLNDPAPSPLLDAVRARWRSAKPADATGIAAEIGRWQQALSRFQTVGHMKPWVVPMTPVVGRQDLRLKLPEVPGGGDVAVYLVVDGDKDSDSVIWESPRLVKPGRPELPLRDLRGYAGAMAARRRQIIDTAAKCLAAAAEATPNGDRAELAKRHEVDPEILAGWLEYLGIDSGQGIRLDHFTERMDRSGSYDFVKGWGSPETPLLVANSSDEHVRIPGNMKPHGVAVHPSPTSSAAVGWLSPGAMTLQVAGEVTHAHPECGNGVTWSLEYRRGATRRRLASGVAAGGTPVKVGPVEGVEVRPGDLVSLLIGPRDGNHACDLTAVDLRLKAVGGEAREWDLAKDVSGDVLAGNPHADGFGHAGVWHFYKEATQGDDGGRAVPDGSVLARWLASRDPAEKAALAVDVQRLISAAPPAAKESPDAALYQQLTSLGGPLLAGRTKAGSPSTAAVTSSWGLDPSTFGKSPDGAAIAPESLAVRSRSVVEIRLPADLAAGAELVGSAVLRPRAGEPGWAQARILAAKPTESPGLRPDSLVLVVEGEAVGRFVKAFDDFRRWFPAALCYEKIVPVDEVVTLTLFHREDEPLSRLMLDPAQAARLDRLWEELHFVSGDALTQVDAFRQLMEYATQDSDPRLFEPFRKPILEHAEAYRKALLDAEPRQLDALIAFAALAYRRPLTPEEAKGLRDLYARLRAEELPHDEAFRLTLARVFIAPTFLYRVEKTPPGAAPAPVSDDELATRLSYFLRSSAPDAELREAAAAGRLHDPEILKAQTRRLLQAPDVRRMAEEFACQWLHIYDFDALDEKSERHFPTFAALKGAMYEESILFFADLFRRDASVLSIYDADHTFVNEALARHYGIPGVAGPEWRRVEGVRKYHRGGILALSATLAKESGASRTSPILRGNWLTEVLLGEKMPRPPKDVPLLPDDEAAAGGLSVRQLVEKHTGDMRCAGCHARMDPFGFALEGYDAIGRWRDRDAADHPIDTHAKLQDGTEFDGTDGLRQYLLTTRKDAVVRQFCRKLLGYALGRGLQLSDEPLLDEIRQRLEANDFRVSAAVETIVLSRQFREIRGSAAALADAP